MTLHVFTLEPNARPALLTTENAEMTEHRVETYEQAARIVAAHKRATWRPYTAELWDNGRMVECWEG